MQSRDVSALAVVIGDEQRWQTRNEQRRAPEDGVDADQHEDDAALECFHSVSVAVKDGAVKDSAVKEGALVNVSRSQRNDALLITPACTR